VALIVLVGVDVGVLVGVKVKVGVGVGVVSSDCKQDNELMKFTILCCGWGPNPFVKS